MKKVLANLALLTVSVLVAVLTAEGLLRLTDHRYQLVRVAFPDGYFEDDAVLGAVQSTNRPRAVFRFPGPPFETFTNSLGCFDNERSVGADYVLVIGDSATWGYVPAEDNWASQLERRLGHQVVKCGVTGIGTRFESVLLERLVARIGHPPSAVILLYTKNDLNDDVVDPAYEVIDGQRVDGFRSLDLTTGDVTRYTAGELAAAYARFRAQRLTLREWLRRHSLVAWTLYRATFARVEEPVPAVIHERYEVELWDLDATGRPWLTAVREAHIASLLAINDGVRGMGARFIVFDHDVGEHRTALAARLPGAVDLYHQISADDPAKPGAEKLFHRYDGHWTVQGNRVVAEEMFEVLSRAGLTGRAPNQGAM